MSTHEHSNDHHILHISVYVRTLLALMVLMLLTVWAAQVQFPGGTIVNNIIAMTIAVIKATLVVLFFMHVKFSTKITQLWAIVGFVWFSLMFIIFADYATRQYDVNPTFSNVDTGSAMPRTHIDPLSGPDQANVRPR